MSVKVRLFFAVLMLLALTFGYLHLFVGGGAYNFERLHIFLFNLCSGGTILLYFTEDLQRFTGKLVLFLALAIGFAVLSFYQIYGPAIVTAWGLSIIVEMVRIKRFSFIPLQLFKKDEPVYLRFHQASLLCLSVGLIVSSLVILNNEFLHLIYLPKLKLDTFFLGFSFPVSLITMSIIFSSIENKPGTQVKIMKEIGFWAINLGVIFFFCLIIFEIIIPQIIVTAILFFAVLMIFYIYYRYSRRMQQKNFLISGLGFLFFSAVTGVLYVWFEFILDYHPGQLKELLRLHAFASLYGWNLCGLAVICRYRDFPIQLHSTTIIILHWVTVIIAATLANYYPVLATISVLGYAAILYLLFFSKGEAFGQKKFL
ncbi:MAG: hypothetical protein HN580_00610 [Deltaproteobacteria bacterium]|jgi:hypothetical protein|nr:hypothetical protein [Deltaproteobacteria bacterium]MBT4644745.1 hypothetical protein [Deltaproteobacteria bacterium]MBT6614222.1 hypothetical protein [Deltaproteobacteria bacterium]MBT7153874.1 hypothetical protein [Deltaproteobacteria bacterium]MBT7710317.1 hypothetical protein [Deltaproteobacteria bacterium]